jgi:hypothetical protein
MADGVDYNECISNGQSGHFIEIALILRGKGRGREIQLSVSFIRHGSCRMVRFK